MRPAAHSLSFASPKESKQRKGDPAVRVPSLRYGQPAVLGHGACRRTHCALRASFKQLRQVRSRRLASCGASPPRALRSSARPEGHPRYGPSLRSAPMGAGASRRAAPGRAQRWPVSGCSPPVAVPGAGRLRGEHARRSAHASLSDLPQLFERSAPARSEFHGAPHARASQVARSEAKGHGQQGRLFFAYFLLAKQKKVSAPPGAYPGQPTSKRRATHAIPPSPRGKN